MLQRINLHIDKAMSFEQARSEAFKAAAKEERDPTLLSWFDHRATTHSPDFLSGKDNDFIVRDFANKWGGELEVNVNDDYAFTFIDGADYEKHGSSPYLNIEDANGEWYMCLSAAEVSEQAPNQTCCTHLEEGSETIRGG